MPDFFDASSDISNGRAERLAEILEEIVRRRSAGENLSDSEILSAHPEFLPELKEHLRVLRRIDRAEQAALGRLSPISSEALVDAPGIQPIQIPGVRLLEEIHRGGQGTLFRAVQLSTGREVAVKIMHDRPLSALRDRTRFEREVRILGQLKHPNIVTIHESGEAAGHFYFVMDYVEGVPVDDFVGKAGGHEGTKPRRLGKAEAGISEITTGKLQGGLKTGVLPVSEVLRLFAKICDGVHVAHQRGIVHRDLKPANILIDGQGQPRILDFGLAKLLAEDGDHAFDWRTMTETGQFLGSLPWSSPEQVAGHSVEVDSRSDVYSLGVILYSLLTGHFPYDVQGKVHEVADRIARQEPVRPSRYRRELDPDVEIIVLKCLEKVPDRRYPSAGAMADDIVRHLHRLPILARAPSTVYQIRKFVVRNRLLVAIASSILAIVTAFGVWMTVLYARADAERLRAVDAECQAAKGRDDAEREAKTAKAVTDFLIHDLLAAAGPSVARGRNVTAEEAFETARDQIRTAFASEPEIRGSLLATIGQIYRDLGKHRESLELLEESVALKAHVLGENDMDTLQTRMKVADNLIHLGQYERAEAVAEPTYQSLRRSLGEDDMITLRGASVLAQAYWLHRRVSESLELQRFVLERRISTLGEDDSETAFSLMQRATNEFLHVGKDEEAEAMFRCAAATLEETLGADHPITLRAKVGIGLSLFNQRKMAEAEELLAEGVDVARRVFGDEHPETLTNLVHLAVLREKQTRLYEAEELCAEAARTAEKTLGTEYPLTLWANYRLGYILASQGRYEEAFQIHSELLEVRRRFAESDERPLASALDAVGSMLMKLGRYSESAAVHREALEAYRRSADGVPPPVWTLRCLVLALATDGRAEEARPFAVELLDLRRQAADAPNAKAYALNCFARELLEVEPVDLRNPELALVYALKTCAVSEDRYHYSRYILGLAYEANGRIEEAITQVERALEHTPPEGIESKKQYEEALLRMRRAGGSLLAVP